MVLVCCFKQKTAYEMRISDLSSDVCSSDLGALPAGEIKFLEALPCAVCLWTATNAARPRKACVPAFPFPLKSWQATNLCRCRKPNGNGQSSGGCSKSPTQCHPGMDSTGESFFGPPAVWRPPSWPSTESLGRYLR